MDMVWMAKFIFHKILKQNNGQSAVEYILLLAVISALTFTVFKSARFQQLFNGRAGLFANMREGMVYSYRYGLEYKAGNPTSLSSDYSSNAHDTYAQNNGESRFFASKGAYPQN